MRKMMKTKLLLMKVHSIPNAANSRSFDCSQLELAQRLKRGQLKHFELLFGTNDKLMIRRYTRVLHDGHVVTISSGCWARAAHFRIERQWLHVLIDHLYVHDGRTMFEAHLFRYWAVDRLIRANCARAKTSRFRVVCFCFFIYSYKRCWI